MIDARGGRLLSCDAISVDAREELNAGLSFACSLVIVEWSRQVLIGLNRRRHQWELPGGTIEERETAHDAALRELAEETGIRVNDAALLARATFEFAGDSTTYQAAIFQVVLAAPEDLVASDELSDFRWWNPLDEPWATTNILDVEVVRRVRSRMS